MLLNVGDNLNSEDNLVLLKRVVRFFSAVALAICFAIPTTVRSEEEKDPYIPPDEVQITTPIYKPEPHSFEFPEGTYNYEVSWGGIPAADATISIHEEGNTYKIVATARTYSGIDIFYKLRYRAEGLISLLDLTPIKAIVDHRENSRYKSTEITFDNSGVIHSVFEKKGSDPEIREFNPRNFTLDPFSASFLARSLEWAPGVSRQFDAYNGKTRYLITLTCTDQIPMKINGEERQVWVISPKVENLTSPKRNGKLRTAKMYVTADRSRELLKIVSEVFIGSVTTKLESFTPHSVHAGVQVAAAEPQEWNF